ncbi:MAG: RluA family pseudouridine synthase [Acidimicrobiaceae bacterium]|nr:RluA family pseudouridine synthase [Acidimicrobiaceae bacterium]
MVIAEKIPEPLVGERLDRVVSMIAFCSRAQSVSLIESGKVELSGKVVTSKSYKVQMNQKIVIDEGQLNLDLELQADGDVDFRVVWEDDDIVIVDKPSGVVVHPGTGNERGTLVNGLLARYPGISTVGQPERPGIVHRLDKSTSGLMIVAKTERAFQPLVEMMAGHLVTRMYVALVFGNLEASRGIIDAPIGRSLTRSTQMALSSSGKEAITNYEVKACFTTPVKASLVELRLETGRTHQIRVHMRAVGHPVVGDEVYSKQNSCGLERIFLHSSALSLIHPITGKEISFTSELPKVLSDYLKAFN